MFSIGGGRGRPPRDTKCAKKSLSKVLVKEAHHEVLTVPLHMPTAPHRGEEAGAWLGLPDMRPVLDMRPSAHTRGHTRGARLHARARLSPFVAREAPWHRQGIKESAPGWELDEAAVGGAEEMGDVERAPWVCVCHGDIGQGGGLAPMGLVPPRVLGVDREDLVIDVPAAAPAAARTTPEMRHGAPGSPGCALHMRHPEFLTLGQPVVKFGMAFCGGVSALYGRRRVFHFMWHWVSTSAIAKVMPDDKSSGRQCQAPSLTSTRTRLGVEVHCHVRIVIPWDLGCLKTSSTLK